MSAFGGPNPATPRQKTKSGKTLYTPADEPYLLVGTPIRVISSEDGNGCLVLPEEGPLQLEDDSWINIHLNEDNTDATIAELPEED